MNYEKLTKAELISRLKALESSIDEARHKETESALQESEKNYQDLYDSAPDMFASVDAKTAKIIRCNKTMSAMLGYSKDEIIGQHISFVYHPDCEKNRRKTFQSFVETGEVHNAELQLKRKDGSKIDMILNVFSVKDEHGKVLYSRSIYRNITERKKTEETLRKQKVALEQKTIALQEILGQIEIEKKQIKDNVIANAENLLLPIIQKLRLAGESRKYVQLLRYNLKELTSSFGARLSEKESGLTSREIEICNMIKNGLTSKEIAGLLNISSLTIEKHRINIRRKLGIINKNINLTSYLKTL